MTPSADPATPAPSIEAARPNRSRLSGRSTRVQAFSYDDFPSTTSVLDLRYENAPAMDALGQAMGRDAFTRLMNRFHVRDADVTSYGLIQGLPVLREVLGEIFNVPPEAVVVTAGASEALHLTFMCVADPGEQIALPRPAFPGYDQLAALAGLDVVHYDATGLFPASEAESMAADPATSTPPLAARLVCAPHNPTGVITLPRTLDNKPGTDADRGFLPTARWKIWDVAHLGLPGLDETSTALIAQLRARLADEVIVFSLSKLLRMPGARVGCLISTNPDLIAAVVRVKTHTSMSTSRPSQILAANLLTDASHRAELAARDVALAGHRDLLHRAVSASSSLSAPRAHGGAHLMLYPSRIDTPHRRTPCDQPAGAPQASPSNGFWEALRTAGVLGIPGHVFGSPVPGVRLCVAQPPQVIQAAAEILGEL